MTYGYYTRAQPRVRVRRGYPGNEPTSITQSAPVTASTIIYSGQVISLTSGAWVLGCAAGKTPYIAYHDSVDTDVVSSGLLLGLSCSGKFEIETAYFTAAAGAYNADDLPLKADTGATVAVPPSGAGNITLASGWNDTADVIGATIAGGLQTITTTNSEAAPTGSPPALQTVLFATTWLPKRT